MGISSDGQLTYGIALDEGEIPERMGLLIDLDEFEFDEFMDADLRLDYWREGMSDEESSEYWAKRRAAHKAYPAAMEIYCSYDYPMYIFRPNIEAANYRVSRGYVEAIDLAKLTEGITTHALQRFKDWCEKWGVEGEPKWLLSSLYG